MSEFGHIASASNGFHIDYWGAGPFVIAIDDKKFRFEDSDRFGPSLVTMRGDVCENPWPAERSPFWRAHRIWVRQGRRLAEDGITCIWNEPKPTTIRHMGGRHWLVVDPGEEDGREIKLPRQARTTLEASERLKGQAYDAG